MKLKVELMERLCSLLWLACTVAGPALLAATDAFGIEHAADDVVTHTGKIFHTASADEDDGVFLKIVTFAGNVSDDFLSVGQAHLGDFAESGVGLFGRTGHYLHANATALRTVHERR